MREILFRGKRVDNGTWAYGDLLHCDDEREINSESHGENGGYIIPETVGQYTGLTDKNGTRIFEGDIVDIIPEDESSVIKWDDDSARFVIINSCERDFDNYWGHELEIIGNIHDNPELLEGS